MTKTRSQKINKEKRQKKTKKATKKDTKKVTKNAGKKVKKRRQNEEIQKYASKKRCHRKRQKSH